MPKVPSITCYSPLLEAAILETRTTLVEEGPVIHLESVSQFRERFIDNPSHPVWPKS